jgi:hypothetical protein
MAFDPTTLINTVPAQAVKAPQVRRKDAAAVLAFASLGLVLIAAVLVTVHPMELKSKSDTALFESALKSQQADLAKQKAGEQKLKSVVETSIAHEDGRVGKNAKPLSDAALFKSALKSQQAELAKHKVAEQKLKSQVESSIANQDGLVGKDAKPLSDAALFKMAFKSQQQDLQKKDAAIAALKAAQAKRSQMLGIPASAQAAQLTDAKLFQAALKEQNDDRQKSQDSLKADVKAELKLKNGNDGAGSKSVKALRANEKAELKMIVQANDNNDDDSSKAALKVKTARTQSLEVKKARTQSLALVDKHKKHKTAVVALKRHRGRHVTPVQKQMKLPTDSKLYKDALAREGKSHVFVKHVRKDKKKALARAHAAMEKKAAARKASERESVSQEKKLVAFLDSAGGAKVRPPTVPKSVATADRLHNEEQAKKAFEKEKKMKTVVKMAAKYRTGRSELKTVGGVDDVRAAMTGADHKLGKGGQFDFRKTEFARANAIEASLIGK